MEKLQPENPENNMNTSAESGGEKEVSKEGIPSGVFEKIDDLLQKHPNARRAILAMVGAGSLFGSMGKAFAAGAENMLDTDTQDKEAAVAQIPAEDLQRVDELRIEIANGDKDVVLEMPDGFELKYSSAYTLDSRDAEDVVNEDVSGALPGESGQDLYVGKAVHSTDYAVSSANGGGSQLWSGLSENLVIGSAAGAEVVPSGEAFSVSAEGSSMDAAVAAALAEAAGRVNTGIEAATQKMDDGEVGEGYSKIVSTTAGAYFDSYKVTDVQKEELPDGTINYSVNIEVQPGKVLETPQQ